MVMLRRIDDYEEEHVDDNLLHVVWVKYMMTFHLPIPSPKLSSGFSESRCKSNFIGNVKFRHVEDWSSEMLSFLV